MILAGGVLICAAALHSFFRPNARKSTYSDTYDYTHKIVMTVTIGVALYAFAELFL